MSLLLTSSSSDRKELAAALSLIGRLWLREVDRQMLDLLNSSDVAASYRELGGTLPPDASQATLDSLAADYCQLLIGPKNHLPPVQSVWADQKFQSTASASTRRFYELFPGYNSPGSIEDHLGVQLEFAAFLLSQDVADTTHDQIFRRFYASHLTWPDRLLSRVQQKAETPFYRGLSKVTAQLISGLR